MKIYLIRHGETDSNKSKHVMGQRINESLNEEGKRQAKELAEKLKMDSFDFIFSSPLKRAVETAEAIIDVIPVSLIIQDKIKERDFGSMSGKTWEEMSVEFGMDPMSIRQTDFDQVYDYRPYGGESAQDVHQRLIEFSRELKEKYSDKRVLVVAHGGILRAAEFIFNKKKIGHINNATMLEFDI